MNKLGTSLGKIDFAGVEGRLSTNMERLAKAADSVQKAADRFGGISDDAKGAAKSANKFFARGTSSFDRIDEVANNSHGAVRQFTATAQDWDTTSRKLNKILDNPALSADLKDTMAKAQATAQTIQTAVHELTSMVQDPSNKQDLLTGLNRLNEATANVYNSVKIVKDVAGDKGMRSEVRTMLSDARQTMDRVDALMSKPEFGGDLKDTITNVNQASKDLDAVAKQLHAVLDQKHPLVKMIFGRPGYIKQSEKAAVVNKDVVAKPDSKDKSTDVVVPVDKPVLLVPVQTDAKGSDTTGGASTNTNTGNKGPQQ
jgi:methyl-accepting chemotaxis protein